MSYNLRGVSDFSCIDACGLGLILTLILILILFWLVRLQSRKTFFLFTFPEFEEQNQNCSGPLHFTSWVEGIVLRVRSLVMVLRLGPFRVTRLGRCIFHDGRQNFFKITAEGVNLEAD